MAGLANTRARWQRGLSALARRAAAWLAILGLLTHASLPLLHAPRAAAATLDETVVICSGFGVKVVQLADLAGTDSQAPQKSRIYYCPICLAQQMAGAVVLPDGVPLAAPSIIGDAVFPARAEIVVAPHFYSDLRARAPPQAA